MGAMAEAEIPGQATATPEDAAAEAVAPDAERAIAETEAGFQKAERIMHIETMSGNTIQLYIDPLSTIIEAKRHIKSVKGIPVQEQTLL